MSELARAMELVGNKWALHIVESLLGGPRRFTEIERSLGDVNPKLITVRLRELEADGLVSRTAYAEVPPRVEYALTERGRERRPTIATLRRDGARWQGGRHGSCRQSMRALSITIATWVGGPPSRSLAACINGASADSRGEQASERRATPQTPRLRPRAPAAAAQRAGRRSRRSHTRRRAGTRCASLWGARARRNA